MTSEFRALPSVEKILSVPAVGVLAGSYSRHAVAELTRRELERAREGIRSGGRAPDLQDIVNSVLERAQNEWRPWPRPVVNATGVVIHTNLGRAALSESAIAAVERAARGYSDLEFDIASGGRGSRQTHISRLLSEVTGAEAGIAFNNNAAAVLIGLTAVAAGRKVIVSRGEAVEIGGGFRIPDVLRQSGAELVEVGATNRTYPRDYEAAIDERAGALLKVHTSNFRVTGFTHDVSVAELADIGKRRGLPVLNDLGSGCLLDTTQYGLSPEPTVQDSVNFGADLSFFSGDKLIGGPQAGIVVGKSEWVSKLARHPLARAARMDKMGLAALSATISSYLKETAEDDIPVWRMIAMRPEALRERAESWRAALGIPEARVTGGLSAIGGGSLPGETLPTALLAITPHDNADSLAARLRSADPPVIARIEDNEVVLDPRTVLADQDPHVIDAIRSALSDSR
ncbi:MAG: L-seryl-tRNA(Sec) selenium transferase [Chloroflexota bacterium]